MQTSNRDIMGGYQVLGTHFLYISFFLSLYNKILVLISNISTHILFVQDAIMVGI